MKTNINLLPERVLFYGACLLFAMCLMIFFSSCSVSRNVNKDIEKSRTESTSNEKVNTDTRSLTNTRTTEDFDSCYNFPGSKATGMKPLADLKNGDTLKTENNDVSASVFLDKNGNIGVTATNKPKSIPIRVKKTTETSRNEAVVERKEKSGTTVSDGYKKTVAKQFKAKNNLPWLLLLLIPAAYLIFRYRKQIPYLKNFC